MAETTAPAVKPGGAAQLHNAINGGLRQRNAVVAPAILPVVAAKLPRQVEPPDNRRHTDNSGNSAPAVAL